MANFIPSKKTAQDFHNGVEYVSGNGTTTGDTVEAETINDLVESQLWTQALATNPVDNTDANKSGGEANISMQLMSDGTPQFKVSYLKGETGVSISSVVPDGVDTNGGNKYNVMLTNGESAGEIVAPKGATGEPANIDELKSIFAEQDGTYDDMTVGNAEKLGETTVGSAQKPIYLNNGTPTAVTCVLPVGSIVQMSTQTSPADVMGGVWTYVGSYILSDSSQNVSVYGNGNGLRLNTGDGNFNLAIRYMGGNFGLAVSDITTVHAAGTTPTDIAFHQVSNEIIGVSPNNSGLKGTILMNGLTVYVYKRTA